VNKHVLNTLYPEQFYTQNLNRFFTNPQKIKYLNPFFSSKRKNSTQLIEQGNDTVTRTTSIKEMINECDSDKITRLPLKLKESNSSFFFICHPFDDSERMGIFIDTSLHK